MRINPITYSANYISISKHNNNSDKITFSHARSKSVPYPRRYLPDYYPPTNVQRRTYDSFTGMRDKNYLLAIVGNAMKNSATSNKNLSLAMFDMDNFKSVNELLGYKTGDDFIKEISQKISKTAKENSIYAYRFGGEEFVVVFANQSKSKQNEIVEKIVQEINQDEYINSKKAEYKENAQKRLDEYYKMHNKIAPLIPLKTKKSLLEDLKENFTTQEAKDDEYLARSIEANDSEIKTLYTTLIDERLGNSGETDLTTQEFLKRVKTEFDEKGEISEEDEEELSEYLVSAYDKTFEIHQIKKWLKDFNENDGFSMTGGLVNFSPESMKDKTPLDLINDAGEAMKKGKSLCRGQIYYHSFQ